MNSMLKKAYIFYRNSICSSSKPCTCAMEALWGIPVYLLCMLWKCTMYACNLWANFKDPVCIHTRTDKPVVKYPSSAIWEEGLCGRRAILLFFDQILIWILFWQGQKVERKNQKERWEIFCQDIRLAVMGDPCDIW